MSLIPRAAVLVSIACAGLSFAAGAQTCTPPAHPLFEFQTERPARYVGTDSAGPHPVADPDGGSRARSDSIVVQFFVDTSGRAVPSSLKVLRGGNPVAWAAIRAALPNWRFQPAEAPKGCRVVQLVQTAIEG